MVNLIKNNEERIAANKLPEPFEFKGGVQLFSPQYPQFPDQVIQYGIVRVALPAVDVNTFYISIFFDFSKSIPGNQGFTGSGRSKKPSMNRLIFFVDRSKATKMGSGMLFSLKGEAGEKK